MRQLFILGILLLAFALRVFLLTNQSIWWDEAYAIALASLDFDQILANPDPGHPPGYFFLLRLWMDAAGSGEFAVRFLSVVLGTAAVALLARLGQEVLGRCAGLWLALVAALSPFWVVYSQETRMYALVLALSLGSVVLWHRLVLKRAGGAGEWAGFVLTGTAALWVHFSAAFVLAFEGVFLFLCCFWLGRRDWRLLARGTAALAAAVVLYLPWLGIGLGQMAAYGHGLSTVPPLASQVGYLWSVFVLGLFVKLEQAWPYLVLLAAAMALGIGVSLVQARGRYPNTFRTVAFGALYLGIPTAAFLAAMALRPFFHPKYIIVSSPGLFFLIGLALTTARPWLALPLAGMVIGASLWGLNHYYFDPAYSNKDAGREAVRFLETQITDEDLVLWETPFPFNYYYRGRAPAATLLPPRLDAARALGYNFTGPLFANTFPVALGEEPDTLNHLRQGARRVFYVTSISAADDPWRRVEFYLDKHGRQRGLWQFKGHNVYRYELDPNTDFSLGQIRLTFLSFGDQVALTGVAFGGQGDFDTVESGGLAWAILRWKAMHPGNRPLKYYAHLRDENQVLVAQSDGVLYSSQALTTPYWAEGEGTFSFARLPLRPGTPPGGYELEVGVYEADTLQRIRAVGLSALPVVGRLQVIPPAVSPSPASLAMAQVVGQRLGGLELLGFDPPTDPSLRPGDDTAVTLYWQAVSPVAEGEPSVALLLKEEAGRVFGRQEAVPLEGRHPPSQWREGDIFWERRRFTIPAETPPGDYHLTLQGEVMELVLAQLQITERERSFTVPPMRNSVGASFEGGIELLGYDVEPGAALRPSQSLRLTLYWRAGAPVNKGYTVFTHLLDSANQVRAQHDSPPQMGQSPTTSWVAGQVVADEHPIALSKEMSPGRYELEVGLYDPVSGQRLPLTSGEDRVGLGWVEVGE